MGRVLHNYLPMALLLGIVCWGTTATLPVRVTMPCDRLIKEGVAVHDRKVDMRKYVWPD